MEKLTSRTANIYLDLYHWDVDKVGLGKPEFDIPIPTLFIIFDNTQIQVSVSKKQLEMLHNASWRLMRGK